MKDASSHQKKGDQEKCKSFKQWIHCTGFFEADQELSEVQLGESGQDMRSQAQPDTPHRRSHSHDEQAQFDLANSKLRSALRKRFCLPIKHFLSAFMRRDNFQVHEAVVLHLGKACGQVASSCSKLDRAESLPTQPVPESRNHQIYSS